VGLRELWLLLKIRKAWKRLRKRIEMKRRMKPGWSPAKALGKSLWAFFKAALTIGAAAVAVWMQDPAAVGAALTSAQADPTLLGLLVALIVAVGRYAANALKHSEKE
jgi:hypothetical protein